MLLHSKVVAYHVRSDSLTHMPRTMIYKLLHFFKQQFVIRTLILRILTKHITSDSIKKKSCTVTQSSALQRNFQLAGHYYFG